MYHDHAYLALMNDILTNGEKHEDRTGVGTLSVFGRQIRFDCSQYFPLLTTKKLPLRWVAEELKWFLSGSTNEKELAAKGVDIWKEWATPEQTAKFGRQEGDLGPVYGKLWREYPVGQVESDAESSVSVPWSVDQVGELLGDIVKNPNSRRLIVTGWHPYFQRRVALPPCHTLWQMKCHGDERKSTSLHLYARSIDTFLGLPFNIASYALLLYVICKATDRQPRELIISFGDVHIYLNHIEQCQQQLNRSPLQSPVVDIIDYENLVNWSYQLRGYDPHPAIKAEVAV